MYTFFHNHLHPSSFFEKSWDISSWEIIHSQESSEIVETSEQKKLREWWEAEKMRKTQEESLNASRKGFTQSREKLIEASKKLTLAGNDRVDFLLKNHPYFQKKNNDEWKELAQKIVNEYITRFAPESKNLRLILESEVPELTSEAIQEKIDIFDQEKFSEFVHQEIQKVRISARVEKYLMLIPEGEREKYKGDIEKFFSWDIFQYKKVREHVIALAEESGETIEQDEITERTRKEINKIFLRYAWENNIPIDEVNLLALDNDFWNTDKGEEEKIEPFVGKSILTTYNEFDDWAQEMRAKKDEYLEQTDKYSTISEHQDEYSLITISSAPQEIDRLSPWESLYFSSHGATTDTLYRVEREEDGEYTVSFWNVKIKDVPKKELDVIISLNKVPIIENLFSVNSSLYRTLLREYKFICALWWYDPLKNPPDGFAEFIFRRLDDAYNAGVPDEDDRFLIGKNLSDMPYEVRGRYIIERLSSDTSLRTEVMNRLVQQGIIVGGKLNLSKFPV